MWNAQCKRRPRPLLLAPHGALLRGGRAASPHLVTLARLARTPRRRRRARRKHVLKTRTSSNQRQQQQHRRSRAESARQHGARSTMRVVPKEARAVDVSTGHADVAARKLCGRTSPLAVFEPGAAAGRALFEGHQRQKAWGDTVHQMCVPCTRRAPPRRAPAPRRVHTRTEWLNCHAAQRARKLCIYTARYTAQTSSAVQLHNRPLSEARHRRATACTGQR